MSFSSSPLYLSFEGLVGGGKSTLLKAILPHMNDAFDNKAVLIDEPVNHWISSGILEKSYEEPHIWAFPAQCTFFHTRIKEVRKQYELYPDTKLFLAERCPFSDTLFWTLQKRLQRVDPLLYDLYYDMWGMWQDLMPTNMQQPHLFIYLKPTLDECMRRMKERGRDAEKSVPRAYQQELMCILDDTFGSSTHVTMPNGVKVPILVLDGNSNFRDDPLEAKKMANTIINKIQSI